MDLHRIGTMARSKPNVRRASGTRTMLDVWRNLFRPPTAAQKQADLDLLHSGGELIVTATLSSARTHTGVHWVPQGYLHLKSEESTWKSIHKLPDLNFRKGNWIVRSTPQGSLASRVTIVSLVNRQDVSVHHEMRIPTPDLDLVLAALSDN